MCSAGGGAAGRAAANVRAIGDRRHDGKRMSNGGGRVHGGEWRAVVLSFVYFFCVLAAYYVVRPVREQLSAAVGSTQLPWFYGATRSEEHTSELQSLMRISYAVFCLQKNNKYQKCRHTKFQH